MKKNSGAILLEGLLAIVVFSMVIFALVPMLSFLLRRSERSKYEAAAALLLQEGQEVAYSVISSDWNIATGTYKPALGQSQGKKQWRLSTGQDQNLETRFGRKITVANGCRNAKGELQQSCTLGQDQNTKIVTTEVSWEENDAQKKLTATLILVNLE